MNDQFLNNYYLNKAMKGFSNLSKKLLQP